MNASSVRSFRTSDSVIITASLLRKLRTEEGFMRETFPGEYERYSAQVPALIPFTKLPQSAPR